MGQSTEMVFNQHLKTPTSCEKSKSKKSFDKNKNSTSATACEKSHKGSKSKSMKAQNVIPLWPQCNAKSKPIPVKSHPRSSPVKGGIVNSNQDRMSATTPQSLTPQPLFSTPKGTIGGKIFYAGAKFETHPPCIVLPPPPMHWTTPTQRSHSQPSTPTIKSNSTAIDLASLFGSPITMAKSFPGDSLIQALDKNRVTVESDSSDDEMKEIMCEGTKKTAFKKEDVPSPRHAVNTEDLKKALGLIVTPKKMEPENCLDISTCREATTPLNNFKEMSDQLKSLMKVAA